MRKKGKRLLCLGAAISIFSTSIVFGMETVPPNPLSSNPTSAEASSNLWNGPGEASTDSRQNTQNPYLPGPGGETEAETSAETTINEQINDPGTVSDENSSQQSSSRILEGTVFSGSSQVAAPAVAAQGAVLLNCGTGQILFEKNSRNQFFPASITKIMTALLTVEHCSLSDIVTFSQTATTNLESGAVTISLTDGDQLTVEQSLYALLLKSANEVANGLAEHIAGSVENFSTMMNFRAAQLGCTGTHFANPNGLNNSTHVTTPYDMALIARAAYANPIVSQISTTMTYTLPATKLSGAKTITMGHKMIYPTDSRYYPGMVGGKTGYTSKAGNTLVTCAERNGVRLIAVVMKASGTHYTDTKAMLDYGFALAANGEIEGGNPSYAGMQENTNTLPTGSEAGNNAVPSGWGHDENGWYYQKSDGKRAAGESLVIEGKTYWFEDNGYIAVGWKVLGQNWYYFYPDGHRAENEWISLGERWYYVGADGSILTNTITPDGRLLGADGAWIP